MAKKREMNENSLKNLKKFDKDYQPSSQAKSEGQKKRKKTQEIAKALVEQVIKNKNGEEKTIKEVMFIKQMEKALKGDRSAYELVLALIGEDPVHKQEIISANVQYQKVFVTKQEQEDVKNHIENFING